MEVTIMNDNQLSKVEATLLQLKSMAQIALNNTNYELSGYEDPFIAQTDMSNLLWAMVDLADRAFDDLHGYGSQGHNLSEGENNDQ